MFVLALLFASALPFHLQDTAGAWHDASEWRGAKAEVLLFISIDCPICNSYVPEFARLHAEYVSRGVRFYAVQPDASRKLADVQKYVADYHYEFPVLQDPRLSLTHAVAATIQPQAVVLSPAGAVLYSGRVDDRYISIGKSRYQATRHDLRDAIDAVLAGKPVAHPRTQAVGCFIPNGN